MALRIFSTEVKILANTGLQKLVLAPPSGARRRLVMGCTVHPAPGDPTIAIVRLFKKVGAIDYYVFSQEVETGASLVLPADVRVTLDGIDKSFYAIPNLPTHPEYHIVCTYADID